ncbi:MAG: sulfur carrier protein ThiS [Pseudomonadota bacterium]
MQICLNGKWRDVGSESLDQALSELGYQGATIATALNGTFVPQDARGMTKIKEGDRIEIVAPMQGG